MLKPEPIHTDKELEFAIFCIENTALRLGINAQQVYYKFTKDSDILNNYIIPCYDVLHTQSKDYIVDELINVMKKKGVAV